MNPIKSFVSLLFVILISSTGGLQLATALPISGSYTFDYDGKAPDDTMVRITAVNKDGTSIDSVFDIGGKTAFDALTSIKNFLSSKDVGGLVDDISNPGNAEKYSLTIFKIDGVRIKKVDGGASNADYHPKFEGKAKNERIKPGETWKVSFSPEFFDSSGLITEGGDILIDIPLFGQVSTFLNIGQSPSDAANELFSLLLNSGFPDVEILPSRLEISFLTLPSGQIVDEITELSFSGANLHLGVEIPSTIPEPRNIILLFFGFIFLHVFRKNTKEKGGSS